MARGVVKSISSKPVEFIPKKHREDPDLDINAEKVIDRPMVFEIKKMSRDEQFMVRDLLEFKDETNPDKGVKGTGDVARYIWENLIIRIRNVVYQDIDGTVYEKEMVEGEEKDKLWYTNGMEEEQNEAILFARETGELSEAEAKN